MGHNMLIAAFVFSLISIIGLFLGGITKNKAVLVCARAGVFIALGLVTAATAYMIYLLLSHNFAIEYVAEYTMRDMSPLYLVGALWAGNLGTLLFWTWLIAAVGALVVITGRARDRELAPYATAVVMITEAFLLGLMLFIKNPFSQMALVPAEGLGLNPLLKNIVMLLHPPVIMAGYAGFTIPFALAIAALVTGKLGNDWLITARRWALLSWLLLGAGIIMGAWFSYTGLGGGSYWHWEPVENVSLIPWLSATAFLHSIAMQRKRGAFKVWSMLLIILTFGVVIFSTFMNRSDIIASGHTFSNSVFGPPFLGFLAATMLISLILVLLRWRGLEGKLQIESLVSKEGTFLLTNLLLIVSTLAILAGTIYLLLNTDARALQTSQAVHFFNQVNVPIFLAIILLAGICTTIGWRQVSLRSLGRSLLWPFVASVLLGLALFLFGLRQWFAVVGLAVCCFVPFAVVTEWVKSTRARHRSRNENYVKAFLGLIWNDKPRHGGHIVHIALILIAAGIIGSSAYSVSKEASLMPGESMTVGGYSLVYEKLNYGPASGRMIFTADISVYKNSRLIGELKPVTYFDRSFNGEVNTAAIRSTPVEDLYVTIAGWNDTGLTEFKARVYPLTMWIWIGAWLMLLGGLIAFWPERERSENTPVEEQNPI